MSIRPILRFQEKSLAALQKKESTNLKSAGNQRSAGKGSLRAVATFVEMFSLRRSQINTFPAIIVKTFSISHLRLHKPVRNHALTDCRQD